jgi:hypothetical protein
LLFRGGVENYFPAPTRKLPLGTSRLRPFYQLMLASEFRDWQAVSQNCTLACSRTEAEVSATYWDSVQWVRQVGEG